MLLHRCKLHRLHFSELNVTEGVRFGYIKVFVEVLREHVDAEADGFYKNSKGNNEGAEFERLTEIRPATFNANFILKVVSESAKFQQQSSLMKVGEIILFFAYIMSQMQRDSVEPSPHL